MALDLRKPTAPLAHGPGRGGAREFGLGVYGARTQGRPSAAHAEHRALKIRQLTEVLSSGASITDVEKTVAQLRREAPRLLEINGDEPLWVLLRRTQSVLDGEGRESSLHADGRRALRGLSFSIATRIARFLEHVSTGPEGKVQNPASWAKWADFEKWFLKHLGRPSELPSGGTKNGDLLQEALRLVDLADELAPAGRAAEALGATPSERTRRALKNYDFGTHWPTFAGRTRATRAKPNRDALRASPEALDAIVDALDRSIKTQGWSAVTLILRQALAKARNESPADYVAFEVPDLLRNLETIINESTGSRDVKVRGRKLIDQLAISMGFRRPRHAD
ncbi:MAG: hypothetical protein H6729_10025 [Deltaproteobacteria bacterium]|nr:hypothetical protein [Deltaproteobacteria bacterium]